MPINLPDLPYEYDALEPVVSSATLKLHHGAHHRGYVEKLNGLIEGSALQNASLEDIVRRSAAGRAASPASVDLFNNAAQAWNHAFFWRSLRPRYAQARSKSHLAARFGEPLKSAAKAVFGSGWVWLVDDGGRFQIRTTANADTPLVHGERPLVCLDVWEHAYYLDYQSRRAAYVDAVVDVLLDWDFAERNLAANEDIHA